LSKPLNGCGGVHCHGGGAGKLTIDSSNPDATYAALVNASANAQGAGLRVVPGDPSHSFLFRKLTDQLSPSEGDPMPPPNGGAPTPPAGWTELPQDQIDIVRCWIQEGAKKE
jgi:hypothetical protein